MRAHYLQHVPFEGLGSIETWLHSAHASISATRLYEEAHFPALESFDLLIIMGGPMSVNDDEIYPWLAREKAFIAAAIAADKAVLGICLGAQLIAAACGATIYANPIKEIGWFPITPIPGSDAGSFCFDETATVFHWHGETFTLPPGAHHLARSAACNHQAFQLAGKAVIGLQFHLETTPESLRGMVQHCGEELKVSDTIQSALSLLASPPEAFVTVNQLMARLLQYLTTHQSGKGC